MEAQANGFEPQPQNQILHQEYQKYAREYAPFIKNPPEGQAFSYQLDKDIEYRMNSLPELERNQVLDFAHRVTSYLPDESVLNQGRYYPTSRLHMKAIVADIYNHEKQAADEMSQDVADKDMYVRMLAALTSGTVSINHTRGTEKVLEDFIGKPITSERFYNFIANMLYETLPAFYSEKQREEFNTFYTRMQEELGASNDLLNSFIVDASQSDPRVSIPQPIPVVYVASIKRAHPATNDEEINKNEAYNKLNAKAITFGVDPVTSLPLVLYTQPYLFEYDEVKQEGTRKDPVYSEVSTMIHERIHDVANITGTSSWDYLVNELVTDATAEIVQLRTHGQSFLKPKEGNEIPSTNYGFLIHFAQDLVKEGIISEKEIINYGLAQDPKGFTELFAARVKATEDPQKIQSIIKSLLSRRVILPIKRADIPNKAQEMLQDPATFLMTEGMKAWDTLGGAYLGATVHYPNIFERFYERNKIYVDEWINQYNKEHPDRPIDHTSYKAQRSMVDSKDDLYTEEAVDAFYEYFDQLSTGESLKGIVDEQAVIEYLNTRGNSITITSTELQPQLILSGNDNPETIRKLIGITNRALEAVRSSVFLDLDLKKDTQGKLDRLIDAAPKLYIGIGEVLSKNWEAVTQEDVFRVIRELIHDWYFYEDENKKPKTIDSLVDEVKTRVDILTTTQDHDDIKFKPPHDFLFHYGRVSEHEKINI